MATEFGTYQKSYPLNLNIDKREIHSRSVDMVFLMQSMSGQIACVEVCFTHKWKTETKLTFGVSQIFSIVT